ncbi:hypothetical protein AGRA3207_001425 [Actinomadura graeca]|uniref:Uncharacterized protein n=1 Tax=Actinomadura graeca TaxID=2750812 RepID=A0ABX8QPY1_9ACTN|nr:hypothetical protein [Actinomadura graeca]QXJ20670.1 hypothetical protein AGRA3207_001425 [Actinomadura graeca]
MQGDAHAVATAEIADDPWFGEPVVQQIAKRLGPAIEPVPVPQMFAGLSPGMTELMALGPQRPDQGHSHSKR